MQAQVKDDSLACCLDEYGIVCSMVKKLSRPFLKSLHNHLLSTPFIRSLLRNYFGQKIIATLAAPQDAYDICVLYKNYAAADVQNTKKLITDGELFYIISKFKNKIIGVGCLENLKYPELWNGWWLSGLQVRSSYKGIGAGQAIVNLAIQKVKEMDGSSLKLLAFEGRKQANSLYEKLGFERITDPEIEQLLEDEVKKGIPRRIYMVKEIS